MSIRYYAKAERVSGEPTPGDPGSAYTDFSIPSYDAFSKRDAAKEKIEAALAAKYGGEWRATNLRSSRLKGGR